MVTVLSPIPHGFCKVTLQDSLQDTKSKFSSPWIRASCRDTFISSRMQMEVNRGQLPTWGQRRVSSYYLPITASVVMLGLQIPTLGIQQPWGEKPKPQGDSVNNPSWAQLSSHYSPGTRLLSKEASKGFSYPANHISASHLNLLSLGPNEEQQHALIEILSHRESVSINKIKFYYYWSQLLEYQWNFENKGEKWRFHH